jgi:hypothetical protein
MKKNHLISQLAVCLCALVITAQAADSIPVVPSATSATPTAVQFSPWDRGAIRMGGFAAAFDSTMTFGLGQGGVGLDVNVEKLLGLESSLAVFRIDGLYRIGESRKHQVDFTYASFHRSAQKTLTQQIDIDGEILLPGSRLESLFNIDIYRMSYAYSFFQDDRVNIGAGLGMYVAPVEYGISIIAGNKIRSVGYRSVTVPLPALSLRGDLKLTPKVSLYGELDAMYMELGGFTGSLVDLRIGCDYQFTKNFSLGFGYNSFNLNVECDGSGSDYPTVDFIGAVKMRYTGLLLYAKFSF